MAVNKLSSVRPLQPGNISFKPSWLRQWSPFQAILVGSAALVAALILLVPAYLLLRTVTGWENAAKTLLRPQTWQVLGNTVILAVSVTAGTAVLAIPLAWLTACTNLPGRRLWNVLVALPLVIPSYVAAYLYASLLTPKGLLQQWLYPLTGLERLPEFYGFPGAFLVLTIISYPFTYLTVRAAFKRMDPALTEAARSLGVSPRRAFFRVTLPYLRPSILAGSLLVILYVLRDFGAVTMLQYSTFTRIIYNRYTGYRLDAAATLALVLVALTAVILIFEHKSRGRARYTRTSIGAARQQRPVPLGKWTAPALVFVVSIVFVALIIPAGGLIYWFWRGWQQDYGVKMLDGASSNTVAITSLLEPAWHSFSASFLGAVLAMTLALPIAILVVRRPGRLSQFFEKVTYASFALPGIVVALAFVFFGINFATSFYQTLPMLLLAYVILFIPQAVGAERASLMQVSTHLEEAGRSLGQRPSAVFRRITLPLVRPGIIAGGALVFLTAMKELPATLILSPLGANFLSAQIWTNINEAFFARAAAPTLLLILLSSIPLAWMTLREKNETGD
ncbi:MAG: iron ABC transporter permease [Chloroflexi bacterium]|nr:iron ABC transporter permease [Chloroflexota bacterium]